MQLACKMTGRLHLHTGQEMSLLPPLETTSNSSRTNAVSSGNESVTDQSLFPMPLAPIEKFLVLDDRPECPMTSFIELHFASELQIDLLKKALLATVHQHPLLASRLIEIDGQMHWDYDPNFVPQLRRLSEDTILDPPSESPRWIDLRKEPGCQYWYGTKTGVDGQDKKKCRLVIQLHHATCDGVGLRRVLIDTLSEYASLTLPAQEESSNAMPAEGLPAEAIAKVERRKKRDALDPTRLLLRADFSEIEAKPVKVPITGWEKLKNAYYFYLQKPRPLKSAHPNDSNETVLPSQLNEPLRHHIFDETTSERILTCCRKNEVSLNDLSLTILFRTCRHWNLLRGAGGPRTRIRVLMPFDLRSRSDLKTPATNRLSFSFLGRTHRECEDWPTLLASVQTETQWIKQSRVYMDFLHGLAAISPFPKRLDRMIRWNRNMCTSVLTYTGDITRGMKNYFPEENGRRRVGDSHLENILIAPPARENTNISMGVCINWGQICLSVNWNRVEMSDRDSTEFLQIYADAMSEWLRTMTEERLG